MGTIVTWLRPEGHGRPPRRVRVAIVGVRVAVVGVRGVGPTRQQRDHRPVVAWRERDGAKVTVRYARARPQDLRYRGWQVGTVHDLEPIPPLVRPAGSIGASLASEPVGGLGEGRSSILRDWDRLKSWIRERFRGVSRKRHLRAQNEGNPQ